MGKLTPAKLAKMVPFLDSGGHERPDVQLKEEEEVQMCVMEAVSYIAGEKWSDHPKCADELLTDMCIHINDGVDEDDRQKLRAAIPALVGSRINDRGVRAQRAAMLVQQLIAWARPKEIGSAVGRAVWNIASQPLTRENLPEVAEALEWINQDTYGVDASDALDKVRDLQGAWKKDGMSKSAYAELDLDLSDKPVEESVALITRMANVGKPKQPIKVCVTPAVTKSFAELDETEKRYAMLELS